MPIVIDDFTSDTYEQIRDDVWNTMNSPIWQFGWHSTKKKPEYAFWNRMFLGNKNRRPSPEQQIDFVRLWPNIANLVDLFESHPIVSTELQGLHLSRVYANGYTYGCGGAIHRDDGVKTLLYFATPDWDPNWNGETLFFDDDKAVTQAVQYVPGRFIIFNAKTWHQGREVAKTCTKLRTIIACKWIEKEKK